jgi:putative resolvase
VPCLRAIVGRKRRLVVPGASEVTGDLVRDEVEVLASLCARFYGCRAARNPALKALSWARQDIGPRAARLEVPAADVV